MSPYDFRPLIGPTVLNALQQTSDRLILCSCRGNEFTPEAREKKLGVFAYRMIVGLCGPASDPASKQVTLQRLNGFLFKSLDEQHRPQLFGQERRPVVLVGDMAAAPLATQQNSQPAQSPAGQTAATGELTGQALQNAIATAQMSPTTSGQLQLSAADQQCALLLRQARQFIQLQNPVEAFECVEQALQIAPNNVQALILKGQLLGTAGRFQEALKAVEQVLKIDTNNALAWSMRAALLSNTGHYQMALQAIELSLELDPNNPETYSIKTSIMGQIAAMQSHGNSKKIRARTPPARSGAASFFSGLGMQIVGLALGIAGAALPIIRPGLPFILALALQSLGLAILCINAVRGSFLYGFARFFLTLLTSVVITATLAAGAILGGANKIGTGRIYTMILHKPVLLVPLLFFAIWLAAAAVIPLLLGFFSFIAGLIAGVRRK